MNVGDTFLCLKSSCKKREESFRYASWCMEAKQKYCHIHGFTDWNANSSKFFFKISMSNVQCLATFINLLFCLRCIIWIWIILVIFIQNTIFEQKWIDNANARNYVFSGRIIFCQRKTFKDNLITWPTNMIYDIYLWFHTLIQYHAFLCYWYIYVLKFPLTNWFTELSYMMYTTEK